MSCLEKRLIRGRNAGPCVCALDQFRESQDGLVPVNEAQVEPSSLRAANILSTRLTHRVPKDLLPLQQIDEVVQMRFPSESA